MATEPSEHTCRVHEPLQARVAAYCARHDLLPAGAPVLVMLSGGPDSTCLLHVLREVHDGPLGALVLDHGLRKAGASEARDAAAGARAAGVDAGVERLGLAPGAGIPARARATRLAAARRVASEGGYARVAVGHTASDQAETVLFRLARGTGRTGALGMAPRRGALVRPLLAVTGAETRRWCADRGLAVAADPTNDDRSLARGRVRHDLVPALARVHPGAERHVAALADALRDEAALLDALVAEAWARCAGPGEGLRAAALAGEPAALRPLLVRRLLRQAGLGGEALAAAPVARVLALAAGPARAEVPGGVVVHERGIIAVAPPPAGEPQPCALPVPGAVVFAGRALSARRGRAAAPSPGRVALAVEGPLVVRGPRPGDRIVLPGGRQAVGRLLAAARVPARERPRVPVVAAGERVVWVAGHRAAHDALAPPGRPAVVLEVAPG